jgi:large subunit ribosomal protein L28
MVTGKKQMVGNNVSHAQNKTKRTFQPNLQNTSLYSETLGRKVKMRVSAHGLRTVDHKGGLDNWLTNTAPSKLEPEMRKVKAEIEKAKARQAN